MLQKREQNRSGCGLALWVGVLSAASRSQRQQPSVWCLFWIDAIYSSLLAPGWGLSEFLCLGRSIPSGVQDCFPLETLSSLPFLIHSHSLSLSLSLSLTHTHTHTVATFCNSQRELVPGTSVWCYKIHSFITARGWKCVDFLLTRQLIWDVQTTAPKGMCTLRHCPSVRLGWH